jgi:hypothetical protein
MSYLPLVRDRIPSWTERLRRGGKDEQCVVLQEVVVESEELMQNFDEFEKLDPTDEILKLHDQVGLFVTAMVSAFCHVPLVARLVWRMLQITSQYQVRIERPVHRGRDYYNAGLLLANQGDLHRGAKLVVLALIEDIYFWKDLGRVKESCSYQFLVRNGYDERIATRLHEKIRSYWDTGTALWHPEDILYLDPEMTSLLRRRIPDVGLSLAHLSAKVEKVSCEIDSQKKGPLLEELAHALLSQVDGVRVLGRHERTETSDVDVLCRVESNRQLEVLFGPYILVECKNWDDPVGSPVIRDLVCKLLSTRLTGGILLTKSDITGDCWRGAYAELSGAFHRHGIVISVLTLADIRKMKSPVDVTEIIMTRAEMVRFELPPS